MRRISLLMIPLLLAPCLAASASTQQPVQNTLPDPADYVAAGPHCKRKVSVSPWVGTPVVDWPTTYRCVLDIHTCDGTKTYTSSVRPGGTDMCADYWNVHNALVNREICCDRGPREDERPAKDKQP